jgi:hypothetical protein
MPDLTGEMKEVHYHRYDTFTPREVEISTLMPCSEANMSDPEELVVFMTLPLGVDESIIPGVLASRGIPVHLSERRLARQGRYVEIQVPASRLEDAQRALDDAKRIGEQLMAENEG